MQIGMIGLGRMGMNMARRLLRAGHQVVAWNRNPAKVQKIAREGAVASSGLADLVAKLTPPRVLWLMLPAGETVDRHVEELARLLAPGDLIVEGGNSRYQDDVRRAAALAPLGIRYVDAGVSGGIWGLEVGYCTMVGGEAADVSRLEPLLRDLAPANGYLHCGPVGAGHYVKMIHNGIEYGMMQAYGEGFALLESSPYGASLDLRRIASLWNQGSVVRSWLLELLERALAHDPRLEQIRGKVDDSGEGRWTVDEAVSLGVPAPVLTLSLFARFQSRDDNAFGNRVLAALRREFGGHAVVSSGS